MKMKRMKDKNPRDAKTPDDWDQIGRQTPPDTPQPSPDKRRRVPVEPMPNSAPKVAPRKPSSVNRRAAGNSLGQGFARLTGAQVQHVENCSAAISKGFRDAELRDAIDGALSSDSDFLDSLGFGKGR